MQKTKTYFVPVRKSDVDVGQPLKWSIYNQEHQLLLKRGQIVETQAQMDRLFLEGLCRDGESAELPLNASRRPSPVDSDDDASPNVLLEFDEIRIPVGEILTVQLLTDLPDSRYPVRLIGHRKNKSIIISAPENQGGLVSVKEGQVFVVRFFSGKNAYAFTTSVLRVFNTPYPHLHLSYPAEARGRIVRKGERVPVKIICSIDFPGNPQAGSFAGTLLNLSTGGALISSKKKIGNPDSDFVVKFRIFVGEVEFLMSIDSVICTVRTDDQGAWLHGVRFRTIAPETQVALMAYAYQLVVASGG